MNGREPTATERLTALQGQYDTLKVAYLKSEAALAALHQRHAAVRASVNASCTCGGRGPEDEGACPACRVWHRWTALEADHE